LDFVDEEETTREEEEEDDDDDARLATAGVGRVQKEAGTGGPSRTGRREKRNSTEQARLSETPVFSPPPTKAASPSSSCCAVFLLMLMLASHQIVVRSARTRQME
jgi:hypothetical protein